MGNLDCVLSNVHTVHYCMIHVDVISTLTLLHGILMACLQMAGAAFK